MRPRPVLLLALLLTLLPTPLRPALGQDPPPGAGGEPSTEEWIERERLRASVEAIFERYFQPAADGSERTEMAIEAVESFVALGPDAVPYLVNELEQDKHGTYDLCSYALGMLATPEAEMALRDAVVRADDVPGGQASEQKAWAIWGLGLQGHADGLRLLTAGRHHVANYAMHGKTTVMEAVALQTAPASLPILLGLLEPRIDDASLATERNAVLSALRRLGDPAAAPRLVPLLQHDDPLLRHRVAVALRTMATPPVVAALAQALEDESKFVRRAAARSLEYAGALEQQARWRERLEQETDAFVRSTLYRLLAEAGGTDAAATLLSHLGRPDPVDRRNLIQVLATLADDRVMPVLRDALEDEDTGVALEAVKGLEQRRDVGAIDILSDAVATGRRQVAEAAASSLAGLGVEPAGAVITKRLLDELVSLAPTGPRRRHHVDSMAASLLTLGHTKAIPALRETLDQQRDGVVRRRLEQTADQLALIRRNGRKVARWVETARAPEPELRQLAWTRLGSIGNRSAERALVEAFEAAQRADRSAILEALGTTAGDQAAPLLERVLTDPFFDHPRENPLRDMAAWSARRIGGEAMVDLLREAARRRDGRDARVLVYAAVLGGERSLPLLRSLRTQRMRYLGWARGQELERLDWIAARLAAGRSIAEVDVPPGRILFR